MSLKPRTLAVAGLFALASAGCATTAQAAPVDQAFVCNFPQVGLQPIDVVTDAGLPAWIDPAQGVPASPISVTTTLSADAAAAIEVLGGDPSTITGSAAAHWQLYRGQNFRFVDIPLSGAPVGGTSTGTIPATQISDLGSPGDPLVVSQYTITLDLSVKRPDGTPLLIDPIPANTDSDGDPTTFDVLCSPAAGVSSILTSVPTVAPTPTPTPTDVPTPTPTPTGGPTPTPTPVVTPTPTPTPTAPSGGTYAVTGAATLKSLVKGTLPVTGKATLGVATPSNAVTGDLTLNQSSANLTVLGFLPVSATVQFAATAPLTGQFTPLTSGFKASQKVRVKLPSFKLVGLPLVGGSGCQASQVSTISLANVGAFSPLTGGTLAGTFSISNLTGCGLLSGLVSPLTASNDNAISLKLAYTGPTPGAI